MILLWAWAALAAIVPEAEVRVDQPVTLEVTAPSGALSPGETVRVLHQPGSARATERAIGITDRRGRVSWTPAFAGVAELRAGDQRVRVLVGRSAPPSDAIGAVVLVALTASVLILLGLRRRMRP